MYFGGSLGLLAVGAVLAFAVADRVEGVNLTMVGYILMAVGALGIVLALATNGSRKARGDELPPRRDTL